MEGDPCSPLCKYLIPNGLKWVFYTRKCMFVFHFYHVRKSSGLASCCCHMFCSPTVRLLWIMKATLSSMFQTSPFNGYIWRDCAAAIGWGDKRGEPVLKWQQLMSRGGTRAKALPWLRQQQHQRTRRWLILWVCEHFVRTERRLTNRDRSTSQRWRSPLDGWGSRPRRLGEDE